MSEGHANLSPSGAPGWIRCPGKPVAEQGYPDSASDAAREGTCAHYIAEQHLRGARALDDQLNVRIGLGEGRGSWLVDADMLRHVRTYTDNVRNIASGCELKYVEARVPIGHITGEEGAEGTADYIAVDPGLLQVHDLKFGKGVRVEAEGNEQLALYALGALEFIKSFYDVSNDWRVELYIHQPRLDHLPAWYMTVGELRLLGHDIAWAASRTRAPLAPRIPGEKQCRFCKHSPHCQELQAFIEQSVTDELPMLAAEDHAEGRAALEQALPKLKMIRDWCAAVEARAIHLLESGTPVGDYKLVAGRSSRQWAVPEEDVLAKLRNRGLKKADMVEEKLVSPAKAEKLLDKKRWERLSRELVVKRPGKPTIAPGSDPRPAVNTAEAVGFTDVTEDDWLA